MVKLDELQNLIDKGRIAQRQMMPSVITVRQLTDAVEALRDEVLALRRVIEEAEDYLSNADHDAAQALLWETLHPGSAAHDAAIDAALQSTERGEHER